MSLPQVFPIFPLEAVVLVPGAVLPLHVFEPRYREMVADALDGTGYIAMAMPRAGHTTGEEAAPPVHPVVGLGRIVQHQRLPDGRYEIVLLGVARMRIDQELPPERPYRVVHAAPLPDEETQDVARLRADVAELIERLPGVADEDRERLLAAPPGIALDALTLLLPVPARDKHRIHAETSPLVRLGALRRMIDLLTGRPATFDLYDGDPRLN